MDLLARFDVARSKTLNTYKPRGWEDRVEKENELLRKLGKIKSEPQEAEEFEHDEEEAGPSNLVVKKKPKRVFNDENDDAGSDSVFDSEDDFEIPRPLKRKSVDKDPKEDHPPAKKSKLTDYNVKKPKPKSKPKGLSISRQIVR